MSESLAKIVYRKLKHLHQVQWDTYSTYSKAPGSDTGVWRTVVLRKVKYNPIVDKVSIINSDDGVEIAVPKIEFFNMMRKVYKILFIERIM